MKQEEVKKMVKTILIEQFNIPADQFLWERPLEMCHKDFKILSSLVYLEQALEQQLKEKIPISKHISTSFHTPQDIVDLITKIL